MAGQRNFLSGLVVAGHDVTEGKRGGRPRARLLVEGNPESVARDLRRLAIMMARGNSIDATDLLWKLLGSGDQKTAMGVEMVSERVATALLERGEGKRAREVGELVATIVVAEGDRHRFSPPWYAREREEYLAGKKALGKALMESLLTPLPDNVDLERFAEHPPWLVPAPKPPRG
jgi:hypothetical protein